MQFERALDRALTTLASDAVTGAVVARACDKVRRAIAETWNDPFEAAKGVGTAPAAGRSPHCMVSWGATVAATRPAPGEAAPWYLHQSGIHVPCFRRPNERKRSLCLCDIRRAPWGGT